MKKKILKILVLLVCATLLSLDYGNALEGNKIKVIDGDSLEVDGKRIRLKGIDAPEYKQYCFDENNKKYNCGLLSKEYLSTLTEGTEFYCKSKETDRYIRYLSICYSDGKNVNKLMLKEGWAIPYRTKNPLYYAAQIEAKLQKKGIYQGKFIAPEIYRRLNKRKKVKN